MALCYCKKLYPLLREITSKHDGNFYRLNCFHSYTTKNKLKKYEDIYKNIDYCYVEGLKNTMKIKNITTEKNLFKFYLLFMLTWSLS